MCACKHIQSMRMHLRTYWELLQVPVRCSVMTQCTSARALLTHAHARAPGTAVGASALLSNGDSGAGSPSPLKTGAAKAEAFAAVARSLDASSPPLGPVAMEPSAGPREGEPAGCTADGHNGGRSVPALSVSPSARQLRSASASVNGSGTGRYLAPEAMAGLVGEGQAAEHARSPSKQQVCPPLAGHCFTCIPFTIATIAENPRSAGTRQVCLPYARHVF